MILLHPYMLLFALLAIVPWVGPWKGPRAIQNVFRSLVFVAISLAMAMPHFTSGEMTPCKVLVIDRSQSISAASQELALSRLADFAREPDSHLVTFGAPVQSPALADFSSVTMIQDHPTRGTSPLSAAISRAQALIPPGTGGSVTIASDSLATRPDDDRAIAALRAQEIPVHWVALETVARTATPVRVSWSTPLRKGANSQLNVRLVSTAANATGILLLKSGEAELARASFSGPSEQTIQLSFQPEESGFVDAVVVAQDANGTENELAVVLPIMPPHQLLYLGDRQTDGEKRLSEILGPSFDVAAVNPNDSRQLGEALKRCDLVLLDDQPAEKVSSSSESMIVDAVQNEGLGLVMSGGRASFGGGGWHDRPIEKLLPVELVQKEEKRDPSTSLVIVIDTSGSMTGVRVQLAKEVSRLAMKRLLPHDKVGIVEFYGAKRWAAPLQPASNAIELQRALNRMDAGGGTVILPALEEAFYGLQNVDTRYKHVLVLTDGGVESGDFESLMRRMANEGINVSTVLAGGGYHSEFLVNIANWGKGRFYNVPNRFNLPEILLKQPSTTKLPSYRPGQHVVQARGGPGWWGEVDTSAVPPLAGYVESKPREGSEILLETAAEKHPILATWRYGLGRVTTLSTEPLGEGTETWKKWPDYGNALARILQRSTGDMREPFRFEFEFDGAELMIHAIRQQPRNADASDSNPLARMHESKSMIEFVRRSPDRYLARLPGPTIGKTFKLETSATNTPDRWRIMSVMSPVMSEHFVDPENAMDATTLVTLTGGQRMSATSAWSDGSTSTANGETLISLSPLLYGLALFLFLAELVYRRLPRRARSVTSAVPAPAVVLFLCLCWQLPTANADTPLSQDVVTAANNLIEVGLREGISAEAVDELFDQAILKEGNLEHTLDWLTDSSGDLTDPRNRVIAEIEVKLAARRGDLQRASDLLMDLLKQQEVMESRLDLVLAQAKFHDALGETDAAKELYTKLTTSELTEADRQTVSLRLALMGLLGDAQAKQGSDAKPLIELATKSDDVGFKNRAANVLAVQDRHADALKLFTITGSGTERFRSASRITEWAIRAKEREKAIETAWQAVEAAQLKRDRNYALALLVEAYRLKEKTAGVEALVDEFKRRNESAERMTLEMQRVWIDLLRELGRYDDAITLFRKSTGAASNFTVEMRRELLELEGEAGNTERMISTYRDLIEAEPDELAWRGGLTQILLEQGDNAQAIALWSDYVSETERSAVLMNAAQTLGELGMDLLAKKTVERMVTLRVNHGQALLYWADLQQRRGDVEGAETSLNRVQGFEDVGDDVRAELASAYERIGRQDKAIEVNEAIRATREVVAEDLEMRLAWLYSEVGDEEKALDQWLALWRKITSIPRRRYVEDRLMTVASRLGTLADIAIEIEEKLSDGTADSREAGLLVRIYSRVNDSVAATEISEEYMTQTGKDRVNQLQEKGRIYQICNDYWNYEKVIEELIEVDPEGETEYLRQLALSMLERGKAQDARKVLMNLRTADDGKDSIGGEFEAGVLSLVGMKEEAADAYRQAIATHPDRIESYLLLANLLKENNQTDRAVGMFQYLAENAQRDDLFTIAIDGLLNMEAKGRNMQWARRITLERLAGREDKNYLYQLLADLSAEVNDKSGQVRAMENSLAVSGTRRLSVLRECMELSSRIRGGVYYSSSSRGPTNKGNLPFFAFGRRLIGLNELMPPQVFLDLGKAFLDDGDTQSAERTFGMARNLADPRSYQREVAEIFEKAGKIPEALARYDRLLRTSPSDVPLMARVAKLNEREGKDAIAFRFYQSGLNLLLSQTPLTTREAGKNGQNRFWSNNRDAYQTYSDELLMGMLVTVPEKELDAMVADQRERLEADLHQISELRKGEQVANNLAEAPRVEKRFSQLQRMYLALSQLESLEEVDAILLKQFPNDGALFSNIAKLRLNAGRRDSLTRLMKNPAISDAQQEILKNMLGDGEPDTGNGTLSPSKMWKALLPAWIKNDREATLQLLRRLDQKSVRGRGGSPSYVVVNGRAVRQTRSNLGDSRTWMQLAVTLGDDSLALQLARANCDRLTYQNQQSFYAMCREILPETRFSELVRYATNRQSQKPERLANYLWLLSEMKEYVSDLQPSDGDLLGLIQNGNLRLGYSFPFPMAMKVFPESIRADALAETMESVTPKILPQELIRVPFHYDKPIDKATQKVILAAFDEGIDAALQDNYLRYCSYYMPRTGNVLKGKENQELAVKMLDLLTADKVQKREPNIAQMAQLVKAMVFYQSGDKQEGIKLALQAGSPFETVSDSYLRMTRTWAYNQLLTGEDTQLFLDALPGSEEGEKLSIENIDKRLAFLQRLRATTAINMVHAQAAKLYPDESKYRKVTAAPTVKPKNVFQDIKLQEKRLQELQAKSDNSQQETNRKTQDAVRTKLATLWASVDHRVNAMKYWTVVDANQRKTLKTTPKQQQAVEPSATSPPDSKPEVKPKTSSPPPNKAKPLRKGAPLKSKATPTTPPKTGTTTPAGKTNPRPTSPTGPASKVATGSQAASGAKTVKAGKTSKNRSDGASKKKYAKGIQGVKEAFDSGDESGVLKGLRALWRVLPPAVSSPYGSRVVVKPLNVPWPSTQSSKPSKKQPPTTVDRTPPSNDDSLRLRKRGGLSTFVPPKLAPATPRAAVWDVLAEHPYVLPEMHRIVRASFLAPGNAKAVSLGLLKAERIAKGDEAVLASLITKIDQGQLSPPVLDGFFEIVSERPDLINDSNKWILDSLMDQMGVANGDQAKLLAPLYAQTGDLNTAAAMFRVSAFFPTKGGNSFSRLIDQAAPFFRDDALLTLAESMFATAYSRKMALPKVLELRRDLSPVETAAAATRRDFPNERVIHDPYDANTLIAGTNIFAANGNHQAAIDCMYTLLKQHGKPLVPVTTNASQYYVNRGTKRPWLLTRANLLDLFSVSKKASTEQQDAWLRVAATAVSALRDDDTVSRDVICEALLTIAYWQLKGDLTDAGKITLSMVDETSLANAKKLEPLAVDLYRQAGLVQRSFELQRRLQQEGNLTYIRFGEFVRDCVTVRDADTGKELFNELVKLSMDEDLLAAGHEIAAEDSGFKRAVETLEAQKKAADEAFRKRAASTAASRTQKVSASDRTEDGRIQALRKRGATPLSAPLKTRALPLKRVLKKP